MPDFLTICYYVKGNYFYTVAGSLILSFYYVDMTFVLKQKNLRKAKFVGGKTLLLCGVNVVAEALIRLQIACGLLPFTLFGLRIIMLKGWLW